MVSEWVGGGDNGDGGGPFEGGNGFMQPVIPVNHVCLLNFFNVLPCVSSLVIFSLLLTTGR